MTFKTFFSIHLALFVFSFACHSQEISNLIFVGDSGITEDVKQAHSFIAIKSYPGNVFERLDYTLGGPLVKLRTYNDSTLSNLNGKYIEYSFAGNETLEGDYVDNLKDGTWTYYNDTGKVILTEVFEKGTLVLRENPDTVKKEQQPDNPGDKEAQFTKGSKGWANYLINEMRKNDESIKVRKSGKVQVKFIVDTTGQTTSIYLRKSSAFPYDEASLKMIRESPLWVPAVQNGRKVKAYRVQPFTFIYDEN